MSTQLSGCEKQNQVRGEDGPEIGCHKLVLASVSPYFRAMIRSQVIPSI